jgi:hypothetical protein
VSPIDRIDVLPIEQRPEVRHGHGLRRGLAGAFQRRRVDVAHGGQHDRWNTARAGNHLPAPRTQPDDAKPHGGAGGRRGLEVSRGEPTPSGEQGQRGRGALQKVGRSRHST